MKSTDKTQDAVKLKLSTEFNSTSRRNWSSYPRNTHQISHRFICHHLHITAQSPNIWRSVFLYIIIVNTIYVLTTRGVDTTTTPSRIHVFFNPYKGKIYLKHTYDSKYRNQRKLSQHSLTISQLTFSELRSPSGDHNDNPWYAKRPTPLNWSQRSPFQQIPHSTKCQYWHSRFICSYPSLMLISALYHRTI